ncbi:hypothetical protein J1605_001188 [Eschrichtius robustus]|uniref:Heat shock cognate 71 kDa protein n=1 Tax=Eschrichtius robustus TaxID=9764 RepID=A0AB34GE39_ESCRO|nr:hypothetical protein J1605_001188 [Eschrichtius robustus]
MLFLASVQFVSMLKYSTKTQTSIETEITFDANAHGILKVSVLDQRIGTEERIITTNDKSCLSKDNIEQIVEEIENYSH